ncbi:MAG: hypothetical protein JSW65_05780, partial [Candidatus Bipolaricaulota bacterium]
MSDNGNVWWLIGVVVLGAAVGILSFSGPRQPDALIAPVVNAGDDMSVSACASVRLQAHAHDPTGGELDYCWTVEGARGSFDDPTQLRPVYKAPEACGPFEEVELTLTVTNLFGVTAFDSLTVLVCDDTCDLPPFSTRIAYPTASGVTTVLPPGMECPWPPVLPVLPEPEDCPPAPVPDCEPPAPPDDCAPPVEPGPECEPPEPPAECPPVVPPVVECEPVPEECAPPPNCPPTADAGG